MNELIKIKTSEGGKQIVSARELHQFLGVKTNVNTWFKNQIERAMLQEGKDFIQTFEESTGGRPNQDYAVTLSSAKEIAMLNGGDKGKQARLYFIECERLSKQAIQQPKELSRIEILTLAIESEKRALLLEEKVKELEPKGDLFDMAMSSRDTLEMSQVAKILCIKGFGRNNIFQRLRDEKVLRKTNEPYQEYVQRGWFKIVETPYDNKGETGISTKTVVLQKGLEGIRQILTVANQQN
jgi:anti-repressor protein